jgi:hypothetical protein
MKLLHHLRHIEGLKSVSLAHQTIANLQLLSCKFVWGNNPFAFQSMSNLKPSLGHYCNTERTVFAVFCRTSQNLTASYLTIIDVSLWSLGSESVPQQQARSPSLNVPEEDLRKRSCSSSLGHTKTCSTKSWPKINKVTYSPNRPTIKYAFPPRKNPQCQQSPESLKQLRESISSSSMFARKWRLSSRIYTQNEINLAKSVSPNQGYYSSIVI